MPNEFDTQPPNAWEASVCVSRLRRCFLVFHTRDLAQGVPDVSVCRPSSSSRAGLAGAPKSNNSLELRR